MQIQFSEIQYSDKPCYNKQNQTSFLSKNIQKKYDADSLIRELQKLYGEKPENILLNNILKFVCRYNKTIFNNSGSNAIFFNIPFISNFGIRMPFHVFKTMKPTDNFQFSRAEDLFPDNNFGQEVFTSKEDITFLKKVDGTPCSINNWYRYSCFPSLIKKQDAAEYARKLAIVAQFPLKTFQALKNDILKISKVNPNLIDSINPNNFIINEKEQTITPIDIHDTGTRTYSSLFHCLFNPLTDKLLREHIIRKLSPEERKQCKENIEKIGSKVIDTII